MGGAACANAWEENSDSPNALGKTQSQIGRRFLGSNFDVCAKLLKQSLPAKRQWRKLNNPRSSFETNYAVPTPPPKPDFIFGFTTHNTAH